MRYLWLSTFLLSPILLSGELFLSPPSNYPKGCECTNMQKMCANGEYRTSIEIVDGWLFQRLSEKERSFLLVEKAKILYVDQRHFEAQKTFLEALVTYKPSHEDEAVGEKEAIQQLLPLYEESALSPESLQRLLAESEAQLKQHPSYFSLEYYSALCHANQGQFVPFFDTFYRAWQHRSDSFLAWKAQGVLHLRLFEASTSEEHRELHRKESVRFLYEAFSRQPQDLSLLVKMVFILPADERKDFLQKVVCHLASLQAAPRRSDCFFFIEQALDLGAKEQAEQLIRKAREWYPYSRALNSLSERLPSERNKIPREAART